MSSTVSVSDAAAVSVTTALLRLRGQPSAWHGSAGR
jgi:hypothetical protein